MYVTVDSISVTKPALFERKGSRTPNPLTAEVHTVVPRRASVGRGADVGASGNCSPGRERRDRDGCTPSKGIRERAVVAAEDARHTCSFRHAHHRLRRCRTHRFVLGGADLVAAHRSVHHRGAPDDRARRDHRTGDCPWSRSARNRTSATSIRDPSRLMSASVSGARPQHAGRSGSFCTVTVTTGVARAPPGTGTGRTERDRSAPGVWARCAVVRHRYCTHCAPTS